MNINIKKLVRGFTIAIGVITLLSMVISFIAMLLTLNHDWVLRFAASIGMLVIYPTIFLIVSDI